MVTTTVIMEKLFFRFSLGRWHAVSAVSLMTGAGIPVDPTAYSTIVGLFEDLIHHWIYHPISDHIYQQGCHISIFHRF